MSPPVPDPSGLFAVSPHLLRGLIDVEPGGQGLRNPLWSPGVSEKEGTEDVTPFLSRVRAGLGESGVRTRRRHLAPDSLS